MVCIQLKQERFDLFKQQLIEKAQQKPFEASFDVTVIVNETKYLIKLQPSRKFRVYALQALRVKNNESSQSFELITSNAFLMSLLDILVIHWGG